MTVDTTLMWQRIGILEAANKELAKEVNSLRQELDVAGVTVTMMKKEFESLSRKLRALEKANIMIDIPSETEKECLVPMDPGRCLR